MGAVHIYVHDHRRPRARDQADGDREEIERQIAFVERLANEQERRGYKNVAEEYRATARNLRAQLEGRPGEKIKMAGFKTSKDASVPMRVQYKGETYWHTGKMGTHIATGEPSAEYESEEHSERTGRIEKTGRRLWRRASGAIEPDSAMGSRDEAAAMAEELKGLVERGHGSSLRARELRQHIKTAKILGQHDAGEVKPGDTPEIGSYVLFKTPGPNGPMKLRGRVVSIKADGGLEVRVAERGYYQIAANEII